VNATPAPAAATNPFATEEAWDVSNGFLGSGDHVVEIREIDGSGNSSGGHPEIHLRVGNNDGEIQDWIQVTQNSIGKVVQLTDAAKIERPGDDDVRAEGTGYRLSEAYLNKLLGKTLGVIVRPEQDRMNPGQTRDRIKGYVVAEKIKKSDVPAPTGGPAAAFAGGGFPAAAPATDDDIPF
jgi:hypothetical protein